MLYKLLIHKFNRLIIFLEEYFQDKDRHNEEELLFYI